MIDVPREPSVVNSSDVIGRAVELCSQIWSLSVHVLLGIN